VDVSVGGLGLGGCMNGCVGKSEMVYWMHGWMWQKVCGVWIDV